MPWYGQPYSLASGGLPLRCPFDGDVQRPLRVCAHRLVESLVTNDKGGSRGRQRSPGVQQYGGGSRRSPEPVRYRTYGSAASISSLDSDTLSSSLHARGGNKHSSRKYRPAPDPVEMQIQTLAGQLAALTTSVATALPRAESQPQHLNASLSAMGLPSRPYPQAHSSPPSGMPATGVPAYVATPMMPSASSPTRRSAALPSSMSLHRLMPNGEPCQAHVTSSSECGCCKMQIPA